MNLALGAPHCRDLDYVWVNGKQIIHYGACGIGIIGWLK